MRILGIDPGLTRCGIGVVTAGPGRTVSFEHVEVLRSPSDAETPARIHQIGASPCLQGLNATGKRRLRHMAQLGGPAETAGFSQADKVFEPFGFHGPNYARNA